MKDIKFKLFMMNVHFSLFRCGVKRKIRKWLYCSRGLHETSPDHLKVTHKSPGKKERCIIDVSWIECRNCETLFFATKKDKNKYVKYKEREKKLMNKFIKSIIKDKKNGNKK